MNPDYEAVFLMRAERLVRMREEIADDPRVLPALNAFYREHPAHFVNDWGVTFDPRNADVDRPSIIPFILTPRQWEWFAWVMERWRTRTRGINEKARDMGVTWCAVALGSALCLFRSGVVIGFGSRKGEYVDGAGTMKPILPKARMFVEHVPEEFRPGWVQWRDAPQMRIMFPTGSYIAGEAGDSIGRGDRTSLYFVDESEHHPRPQLIEASLSNTTNCRIDMSSVNGSANPVARKRAEWNDERVFIFDWREDPRKDDAWYQAQLRDYDPVVVAQEVDRDRQASMTGIVIPGIWVRACLGACDKLGIKPTGKRRVILDVADEGVDKNVLGLIDGVQVEDIKQWSGRGSDLAYTAQEAVNFCDLHGLRGFRYDADGVGAGIRGDVRVINERRVERGGKPVEADGWRASGKVVDPTGVVEGTKALDGSDRGRTNEDYYFNAKAQGWGLLRRRIERTYNWIEKGIKCHPDEIFSINPACPLARHLMTELSQPTWSENTIGKMVVNKKPEGAPSPNLGDMAMMGFAPGEAAHVVVTPQLMQRLRMIPPRRRW